MQVHRYLIGSRRLVASLGSVVKRHGDRRGGRGVGRPPIRRVRTQILLDLIKPVTWVEVYLAMPYIFVAEESTFQVTKISLQSWAVWTQARVWKREQRIWILLPFWRECVAEIFRNKFSYEFFIFPLWFPLEHGTSMKLSVSLQFLNLLKPSGHYIYRPL
jgi:hypothetical protein